MDDVKISPLAKRLAEENSIDWRQIHGTGPEGRVIERDILTYLAKVMSGEAELPYQPDVSEPPPPAGMMPDFGQIPSMASATASLAKEGVDLSSMLADPVFGQKPHVQPDVNLDPVDAGMEADLDDAIFDLDLGEDDIVEESAPPVSTPMDFAPSAPKMPSPSDSADVLLEMGDDLAQIPAPTPLGTSSFVPDLDLSHPMPGAALTSSTPGLSLDGFEPAKTFDFTPPSASEFGTSSPTEFDTSSPTEFGTSSESDFSFQMDDPTVLDTHVDAHPGMDFSLSTPSEPAPSSFESSFAQPDLAQPVLSRFEPIMPEPVVHEPTTPEPVQPVMPTYSTPFETGMAAIGGAVIGAAALGAADLSHTGLSHTVPTTSSAVVRDFFGVSTLRRRLNAKPLLEAATQLSTALDGHQVGLAPFLARAAGRGHFSSSLALGTVDGDALKAVAMPHLEGAFRDLITTISGAHLMSANADLTVLDASNLGADDVVLPVSGALLALGRTNDGQATLTLSGKFDIASGGAFLDRVAGMLENPVGLLI